MMRFAPSRVLGVVVSLLAIAGLHEVACAAAGGAEPAAAVYGAKHRGKTSKLHTKQNFADKAHAIAWHAFETGLRDKYRGRELRLIMINDPFIPAFNTMAAKFERLTGAHLSVDTFGYDATYQKEVLACSEHDRGYAVFVFDVPWTERFASCTDPLAPYLARTPKALVRYDDIFPVMRQATEWNRQIVGFPFAPYFVVQTYNKRYYDALGLQPARTLQEMLANARAAHLSKQFPHVYGTAMNNQSGSAIGQAFFEYIYNIRGGKPFESEYPGSAAPYANMTPRFSSAQSLATVRMFKELLEAEPPGALNTAWTQRQSAFATGHVAMVNEWDVTTPALGDPDQSTVTNDYAIAPFPSDAKLVTQVGGWSMGINRAATDKQLAWDFITWFSARETSIAFSEAGGFPARDSVLADPALRKRYPWYATLAQVIPTAFADCRPRIRESFEIINTLGTEIGEALAGDVSIEEAMRRADREIGALLQKDGYRVDTIER